MKRCHLKGALLGVSLFAAAGLLTGCEDDAPSVKEPVPVSVPAHLFIPPAMPPLKQGRILERGVRFSQVPLTELGEHLRLWVYLPDPLPPHKLPCVLIAPAGTPLIYGSDLGTDDYDEHLPYVRAGFAVVAYELSGIMPDHKTDAQLMAGIRNFRDAEAGLLNARTALDYIAARVPQIDPKRIYTAGHSSAGTLSLLVAEHDPRVRGCITYAPSCDLKARLGIRLDSLDGIFPGYRDFIHRSSPQTGINSLNCPVFLFSARDDNNVPTTEVQAFAKALSAHNPHVTFKQVPTGDHYFSMIEQGIPAGIRWLKQLQRESQHVEDVLRQPLS